MGNGSGIHVFMSDSSDLRNSHLDWKLNTDNNYFISGYTGPTCENTVNPCDVQPCYNGGQCTPNGLTYTCTCTSSKYNT